MVFFRLQHFIDRPIKRSLVESQSVKLIVCLHHELILPLSGLKQSQSVFSELQHFVVQFDERSSVEIQSIK